MIVPLEMVIFWTEKFVTPEPLKTEISEAPLVRLEKFHFPEASRSRLICGSVTVKEFTCSCLEKIKGCKATPAASCFA